MNNQKKLNQSLSPTIFRAYDIRGIVGQTLTNETVSLIGHAIGSLVQEQGNKQVVVARDGRVSGPTLSKALCEGICASGCDVIDLGMVPTPLLYYAISALDTASGVMLTGSHNPPDYNGMKIVVNGKTLVEKNLKALYARIQEKQLYYGQGNHYEKNITEQYIEQISNDVQLKSSLSIVIDAGNGVTGLVAPELYRKLGCKVHELYCDVDGTFPNHHPDPSQNENLQSLIDTVIEKRADIGLAFDGDGDRLGVVTAKGEIISPDRVLMLFAESVLSSHPTAKIIYDVKCTNHLTRWIQSFRGQPIMWKTGHSLIKTKIAETKALLAGEFSGHFFFKDRWYGFDDGLYAGARLLEILSQQKNIDSDVLFARIPNSTSTPELKIPISEEEKFPLMQRLIKAANFPEAQEIITLDGLRVHFRYGWGLIRASNTSPSLVLRFEANNQKNLERIQTMFSSWLLSIKSDLVLPSGMSKKKKEIQDW